MVLIIEQAVRHGERDVMIKGQRKKGQTIQGRKEGTGRTWEKRQKGTKHR